MVSSQALGGILTITYVTNPLGTPGHGLSAGYLTVCMSNAYVYDCICLNVCLYVYEGECLCDNT